MLRSSLLAVLACLSTVVVAQSNVINGPNVCGMRFYSYCCPGWRLHPRTKQCVVPICNRPCGSGYCQRPNSCSCPGGQISVSGCDGYTGGNPCTVQCLNGGSCQGNSCNCPNGFSGTNCGTPLCNPPCQNGGECSGGNRCSCPPGFGGSQCQTDYRTGVCYLQSPRNGICSDGVEGLHCTKALCCATIGQGWGDQCEHCDTFDNPCDRGYILNGRSGQCKDADECLMIPGLCEGGQCTNTPGSYACQCPPGFELSMTTLACVDIDECQTGYLCQNGRCINTQGSFRCDCNPGYFLSQDGRQCTDIDIPRTPVTPEEIGYCYMRFRNRNSRTTCSQELAVRMSFLECCCSVDYAQGWGLSRSDCSPCRTQTEELHRRLCEGFEPTTSLPRRTPVRQTKTDRPGPTGDPGVVTLSPPTVTPPRKVTPRPEGICAMVPNICRNGLCVSLGGVMEYRCDCFEGYENAGRYTCQDINECRDRSLCRYGTCENTDGSFRCVCPSGYKLTLDQRSCEDVDECRTNPNVCHHGTCMNIIGSHTCDCFEGYQKSIDGRYCIDIDECTLGTHRCRNAECENLAGTYECICTEGYEAIGSSGVCIDVNECAQEINPCPLGFCINTLGGYQCQCPVGYATGQDGTCVENRRGFCFQDGDLGRCTHQSMGQMTISSCCCSAVLLNEALSWGPNCESCPPQGTLQFEQLCRHGIGFTSQRININECTLFNNLCDNGVCEDLTGNYKCRCNSGFQPQADGKECIDENECSYNRLLCHNGACRNTPGSFVCECPDGYELDARSSICQDINECENPSLCNNGRCINTRGSYRCECIYPGTELDPTGTICVDNRIATCWTRISNGQCEADIMGPMRRDECCSTFGRAWGSPCEACPLAVGDCPRGFSEISGECVDLDECELNPMVCNNGLCENTMGSYRCVCEEGLTLDTSGRNCIDLRSYECFLDYSEGECSSPIPGLYRNSVCCCSLGYSYGDQGRCYECPQEGSVEFDVLCPRGRGFADTRPRPDLLDGTVYINDINECSVYDGICKYGECTNIIGSYDCICDIGFAMDEFGYQCVDIDECRITFGACGNGSCENTPGDFRCNCYEGFEAHPVMRTCMDIDECETIPGLCRGGSCTNLPGTFRCDCPLGQELTPDGRACQDINECSISHGICSNGECHNIVGTYRCMCNPGFRPTANYRACEDMNECDMNNGGCDHICVNSQGSYECQCQSGYTLRMNGRSCVDVDECADIPDICGGGQCENQEGGYLCDCFTGFRPSDDFRSCLDIDECSTDAAICISGVCKNTLGSYTCQCFEGYSMKPGIPGCSDIDECMLQMHQCAMNSQCENTIGSFQCRCNPGFIVDENANICIDVDECESSNHDCHEYARCVNIPGSYQCQCNQGFVGDGLSCMDVDECMQNQALCVNGQCINNPGGYVCECEMGFYPTENRDSCEDIDECSNFPDICVFGQCINVPGTFRCECNPGYMLDIGGGNCTDVNECEDPLTYCVSGLCTNSMGSYTCECPPNWVLSRDGTACSDVRTGLCYAHGPDTESRLDVNECSLLLGTNIQRTTCCCSELGTGWGDPCELCPLVNTTEFFLLCPYGIGRRVDVNSTRPVNEINQCRDFPNFCQGGECQQVEGSYRCVCPRGYEYDQEQMMCVDIDECQLSAYICGAGTCMNMEGSYTCMCPQGFMFMNMPTGKNCMDIRELTCYLSYNTSVFPLPECGSPLMGSLTKKVCCCSALMAAAWGTRQECSPCPAQMTEDYYRMCGATSPGHVVNPETGLPEDVDECSLIEGICANGICVNTPGSFRCDCRPGYRANVAMHICEDIDECQEGMHRCVGNSICNNLEGNHECLCPRGYQRSVSGLSCDDINECLTIPDACINGQCTNQIGSYVCVCNQGFQLSADGTECNDIDECFRFPDRCGNGTCQNVVGAYACSCNRGFELTINGDCADINECATMAGTCPNGRCVNTPGSFFCDCVEGYVLSLSGLRCEDENECITRFGVCENGRCDNTIGSFRCSCFDGFQLSPSGQECIDTNECAIIPDMCRNGVCQNTPGSFQCTCPDGFLLSSDGLICIDMRRSYCYNDFVGGQCTDARAGNATRKECCCSLGAGWDSPCNLCPRVSDPNFIELCPDGPGYAPSVTPDLYEDINECKVFPGICENGICINTDGSYRCQCQPGFILDTTGRICVDRDECQENYNVCGFNSTCYNTLGSFECNCGEGYQVGRRGTCEDINECRRRRGQCAFRCQNLPGSFRCLCPKGYTLTDNGRHCRDLDECQTDLNTCRYRCKNLIGKFMCLCDEGYTPIGGDGNNCRDINECMLNHGVCQNGRCRNTDGGYTCICNQGYTLGPSGKECMDRRTGFCYAYVPPSGCEASLGGMQPVTMESCCCSGGRAWGPTCQICPVYGTIEYNRLCTDATPVDPCRVVQGLCENGHCLGGSGGYLCQCNPGYILSPDGTRCEDENECNRVPPPCSYQCKNTPGSFKCGCPQGYLLSEDGLTCREKDECSMGIHECQFECRNTLGGFRCVCPEGYVQHGSTCIDVNECIQTPDICGTYGTCQNTQGGHRCECQRNFRPDPVTNTCVDINECEEQPDICQYGCQNTIGGYRCVCPDGFEENFYGRCIDYNECRQPGRCGQATCYNTQGSYQCGCNNGYAFDQQNLACNDINECQGSYGNVNSPCQYSCQNTEGSFSCGCPPGYTSVVQGACVTDRDSVQPCYHCNRNPRQRRSATETKDTDSATIISNNTALLYHVPLSQAIPKHQIAKFKTGYTRQVARYEYVILKGNEDNIFMMKRKAEGMSLLRFSKNVMTTGLYELEIEGVLKRKNDTILAEVQTLVEEPVAMQIQIQIVADEEG
ncbi:fibrillin-2-like [Lytechinus variegatus]|uniref:fibrillin-2-like n=1 Tax=Lytechinus variegatus TaxID=7654 RepID=UPI001BB0F2EB|nr:fibrillin-2-like [Lytechinus variegatus]